ncbi:MAG: hypothetical protein QOI89_2363 [Solirubrobacteraceae bacterium]|jgi:hypothetical protein|nr:hypothetical protein [Solirubrobacteraceae bacterium]
MSDEQLAGRAYARVYRTKDKQDVHDWLLGTVKAAGGEVVYASVHTRAPTFLGIEVGEERIGVLAYVFRVTRVLTENRPADEARLQVRYGGEGTWHTQEHPLGRDVAGVDVTIVIGIDLEHDVILGLDPLLYDPLPMGISVELKDEHVADIQRDSWAVWERKKHKGRVRDQRAMEGLETVIGFAPERLIDYVRFERQADALALEPPLRFSAGQAAADRASQRDGARHMLERQFALKSSEILDIVERRGRLSMAVRGGVAEHHLERSLKRESLVAEVEPVDRDGGDFVVRLVEGRELSVECKNASPNRYSNGDFRVEVQKTRASKGDPESRYYRRDQFDAVAACLFSPTGSWEFRYQLAERLAAHKEFPTRLAALQRVDDSWALSLGGLVSG